MDETNGFGPASFPPPPAAPPAAAKNRGMRRPFLAGVATGAVISALVTAGIFQAQDDDPKPARHAAAADAKPKAQATPEAATEETEEVYNEDLGTDQFELSLKTTSRQCFGSAGCNLTVEPHLSYNGLVPLDPDKTYSITYEIRGGESGAVIETMELSNQTDLSFTPTVLSTVSGSTKLTAKITDIEPSL